MSTLLCVDSSPMGDASFSRRLTGEYVDAWRAGNPSGRVIHRDLYLERVPYVDANWVDAAYSSAQNRTPQQNEVLRLSDAICSEILDADHWVIGVPMHNFTIPTVLSAWVGMIARVGITFSFDGGTPQGLLHGKQVQLLVTSGGKHKDGPLDFTAPYLKAILGFTGIDAVNVHYAEGTAAIRAGHTDMESYLAPHIEAVKQAANAPQLV